MRLHLNTDATSLATTRKLRSIIESTGSKVEEVVYKTGDNVSQLSSFNALPLLETPEGTFFSSNTIARYLATVNKSELYGNGNTHNQALVDQWLDITTCEFQSSARAISKQVNGEKADFGKLMQDVNNYLNFVEKHLTGKKFLVGDSLSIADLSLASSVSIVFEFLFGQGQRKKFANTLAWYTSVFALNNQVGPAELPKGTHDAFKGGKGDKPAKEAKGKKEEKAEEKKAEEDDLFGEDDTPAPKPASVPVKPKKEKPLAKSIVVFDVKVYEQETDLQQLFEKIRTIVVDGLVWNTEPKFVEIAYGMKKLQVGCVVEDAKVSLEDLYEQIEGWEEVQSTDTVSFQKL